MRTALWCAVLAACSHATWATVKPTRPPAPGQSQSQSQHQSQSQSQKAESEAHASAQSSATSQSSAQSSATANPSANAQSSSGGNTQTVHFVSRESAASLAQGALFLGDCGFASNAGGSGRGGAAFLGFAFQTRQCNDFKLAGYYFSIGDYATGCRIIAATPAGKRQARRGIELPVCANPEPARPVPPAIPDRITVEVKEDAACTERVNRAFERCVSK